MQSQACPPGATCRNRAEEVRHTRRLLQECGNETNEMDENGRNGYPVRAGSPTSPASWSARAGGARSQGEPPTAARALCRCAWGRPPPLRVPSTQPWSRRQADWGPSRRQRWSLPLAPASGRYPLRRSPPTRVAGAVSDRCMKRTARRRASDRLRMPGRARADAPRRGRGGTGDTRDRSG